MNNYLIYNNKENFLTHREISFFSTKTCPEQSEGLFCLMIDFFYSNNYLKVNDNNNSTKYIKTLSLTFKNLYSNFKTNSSIILNDKEELHANTPTDLGGNSNFIPKGSRYAGIFLCVCNIFFYFLFI